MYPWDEKFVEAIIPLKTNKWGEKDNIINELVKNKGKILRKNI